MASYLDLEAAITCKDARLLGDTAEATLGMGITG